MKKIGFLTQLTVILFFLNVMKLNLICKMHDSCTCSNHCAYFIKDSIQFQEINVEIQCCATNTGTITENGTDRVRTSLDQDWYPALTYKAL